MKMGNPADMSLERFENAYTTKAAWDIGHPQPALVERLENVQLASPVLEVGCGTGELAMHIAEKGCDVVAVDFAKGAITAAKERFGGKNSHVSFIEADVFSLDQAGNTYQSLIDCCFFHMFDADGRQAYESLLRKLVRPGGRVYMLNFAIDLPTPNAPRAVTADDIKNTFQNGWLIKEIEPALISVNFTTDGIPGTYTCLERLRE